MKEVSNLEELSKENGAAPTEPGAQTGHEPASWEA